MTRLRTWLRLQATPGLGRAGLFHLIDHYGSPEAALADTARGWPPLANGRRLATVRPPAEDDPAIVDALRTMQRVDGWFTTYWDSDYPALLRSIPDPPALLFGRGYWPSGDAFAIVGTRRPTPTGLRLAETIAGELARLGIVIVSGLARGIDAAAHRGALTADGGTIAVLGCGIDRTYPRENAALFRQMIDQGGAVISEYPPGSEPLPGHFPGRNRIISGLSRGTLVVEAAAGSGSLITADFALDQGREVMAAPGAVDRATSCGTNQLIKQGAHPVTETDDVRQLLWPGAATPVARNRDTAFRDGLAGEARKVFDLLDSTPRHIDELAGESGLTAMELSAILLHLELQEGAQQLPGGRYIKK